MSNLTAAPVAAPAEKSVGAKGANPKEAEAKSAEALGTMLGLSLKQLAGVGEAQQIAILALTAILAMSPNTADIDPEKLAVILGILTRGQPDGDKIRQRVAGYIAQLAGISRKLPEVLEEAKKKRAEAGAAKAGAASEGAAKGPRKSS